MKKSIAKKTIVLLTVTFASFALWGTSGASGRPNKPKLTREQQEERKYRHFGGYIYKQQATKVVSIASEQTRVCKDTLTKFAAEIEILLKIPVRVDANMDIGFTIKVEESESAWPLAVFPDNATAIVNVKALSADNPTQAVLEARVSKELWRGLIYALGGGNTYVPQCVMKQVTSLGDLDALVATTACPDAYARIGESARKLGIMPARRASYRQACREGWAPAPTNDVQRAIWNQIHSIPDKPIKIEFDPKKDK